MVKVCSTPCRLLPCPPPQQLSTSFNTLQVSSKVFKRLNPDGAATPAVWVVMPALGGLCTGVVGLAFPEILYQGFGNVNALLELRSEVYAPVLLLQMLGAKVVVTAVCRGSGLVGGIYAPSIFMGMFHS